MTENVAYIIVGLLVMILIAITIAANTLISESKVIKDELSAIYDKLDRIERK